MNVWGDECLRWWMSGWWMSDNRKLQWWPSKYFYVVVISLVLLIKFVDIIMSRFKSVLSLEGWVLSLHCSSLGSKLVLYLRHCIWMSFIFAGVSSLGKVKVVYPAALFCLFSIIWLFVREIFKNMVSLSYDIISTAEWCLQRFPSIPSTYSFWALARSMFINTSERSIEFLRESQEKGSNDSAI